MSDEDKGCPVCAEGFCAEHGTLEEAKAWLERNGFLKMADQHFAMLEASTRTMTEPIRAIICGGRDYRPTAADAWWAKDLLERLRVDVVVHGGALGADDWAGRVARRLGLRVEVVEADWDKWGKRAGPIRNQEMADLGAVAVLALPGNAGTASMVNIARRAYIPVFSPGNWHVDGVPKES